MPDNANPTIQTNRNQPRFETSSKNPQLIKFNQILKSTQDDVDEDLQESEQPIDPDEIFGLLLKKSTLLKSDTLTLSHEGGLVLIL